MKISFEKYQKNNLALFISFSLVIAFFMIGISLWMYHDGGTAQLDLSRPSYQEARDQAKRQAELEKKKNSQGEFSSDGKIDKSSLSEFEKLFSEQLKKVDYDFFESGALSDETFNLKDKE